MASHGPLAFPFALDTTGRLRILAPSEAVEQSVRIILGTGQGERIMRPTFGSRLRDYVFEVLDVATLASLRREVRDCLLENEPRLAEVDVRISTERLSYGELLFVVRYRTHDLGEGEVRHIFTLGG